MLAGHRNGHGIHSPFVYDLVRNVIFNKEGREVPEKLREYHRALKVNQEVIKICNLGAGSRITDSMVRKVSSVVRKSSVSQRQGALLFRIAKWYRPLSVIELGTGLGISTSYFAAGAEKAVITTIEGCPGKHHFAQQNTSIYQSGGLEFLLGDFDLYFTDLVVNAENHSIFFIDGDHRYDPTLEKVGMILEQESITETMVILDDIYWSGGMEKAWMELINHPRVDISLDLFNVGILIRRPEISRQHFRISF